MSGYLQRMIAHVKTPASGVRPLVGSVYSSATASNGLQTVQEEIAAPSPVRSGVHSEEHETRSQPHLRAARDFLFSDTSSQDAMRRETGAPIAPKTATPLMTQSRMEERFAERSDRTESDERDTRAAGAEETVAASEAGSSQVLRMMEATPVLLPQAVPQPLMPLQARPAGLPLMPVVAAPQASVADEIHINIGRIEVTAVPQAAAPRPAPRAPRRGFSLDEYLRKTDGRAQ